MLTRTAPWAGGRAALLSAAGLCGGNSSGGPVSPAYARTFLSHFAEQLALYQLLEPELQHKGVFVQAIASLVAGVCFYLKRCSKNNKGGDKCRSYSKT